MAISKTMLITAVALIAIAATAAVMLLAYPAEIDTSNVVSAENLELLEEKLASGERAYLAFPPRTMYSPGEDFSASLGITNNWNLEKDFRVEIIQDSGPSNGPDIEYHGETGPLSPGDTAILDMKVSTATDTGSGIYVYKILVCTGEPCSEGSDLYYSTIMSFRILS